MGSNKKKSARSRHGLIASGILVLVVAGLLLYGLFSKTHAEGIAASFVGSSRTSSTYELEIAATVEDRTKGLMFRPKLDPKEGMIFVFPASVVQNFWMKDTYISLDMLFLDESLAVVGILENVPILNEERRSVGKPSKYVVELLAGSAKREGIELGAKLQIKRGKLPAVAK